MDQLKIEIVSSDVRVISGKRRSDGQPFEMRRQEAYLHNGHHYPDRFEIDVPRDSAGNYTSGYKPGWYTLPVDCIRINREFGGLELDRYSLRLIPISPPASGKGS